MEIVLELILQVVFEFFGEFLGEVVFRGVDRVWETKVGRLLTWAAFNVGAALLVGFAWGRHVADVDPHHTPTSIFVSLVLAAAFALFALVWRNNLDAIGRDGHWYSRFVSAEKLWWMVLFNVALAAGIWWGFDSATPPLG